MLRICTTAVLACALCGAALAQESGAEATVVFAANLEDRGGCHRNDAYGADLFVVTLDTETFEVSGLRKIAGEAGVAEWFPAFHPDGRLVAYNRMVRRRGPGGPLQEVWVVSLADGDRYRLLENARFPQFSPDGGRIYFSAKVGRRHDVFYAPVSLDQKTGRLVAGERVRLTDARHAGEMVADPHPTPDGRRLVVTFKKSHDRPAGVGVMGADGSAPRRLTPENGSGHASVSPSGAAVAFGMATRGTLGVVVERNGVWGATTLLPLTQAPKKLAKHDPRFGGTATLDWTYPEWLGDKALLVSAQGGHRRGGRREFEMSRLYVVRLKGGVGGPVDLFDFSGAVEKSIGKKGRDFCTAAAYLPEPKVGAYLAETAEVVEVSGKMWRIPYAGTLTPLVEKARKILDGKSAYKSGKLTKPRFVFLRRANLFQTFALVHLPEDWDGRKRRRLIVHLHGSYGNAATQFDRWQALAVDRGMGVAALQYATGGREVERRGKKAHMRAVDVAALVDVLLRHLRATDVMLHGFSLGGALSLAVTCADARGLNRVRLCVFNAGGVGGDHPLVKALCSADAANVLAGKKFYFYLPGADAESGLRACRLVEEHGGEVIKLVRDERRGHAAFFFERRDLMAETVKEFDALTR